MHSGSFVPFCLRLCIILSYLPNIICIISIRVPSPILITKQAIRISSPGGFRFSNNILLCGKYLLWHCFSTYYFCGSTSGNSSLFGSFRPLRLLFSCFILVLLCPIIYRIRPICFRITRAHSGGTIYSRL